MREVPGDGADRSRQGALLPAEKREREEEEEKKKKKKKKKEERETEREKKRFGRKRDALRPFCLHRFFVFDGSLTGASMIFFLRPTGRRLKGD